MKPRHLLCAALWIGALWIAWRTDPWGGRAADDPADRLAHDDSFHMHDPLHPGGKVSMVDQFHLELESRAGGEHRLWISNAFRQEIDPAGFEGSLTVEPVGLPASVAPFTRPGRGKELSAHSVPLEGQVWLTVDGRLGSGVRFDGVAFFWDFGPASVDLSAPLGLDPMVPSPADNPLSAAKVELGRSLFFDPRLSADGSTSCATCHRPEHAFTEPRAVARGIEQRTGRRNTNSVLNSAYQRALFWDGRSASLEDQALEPILSHAEMGVEDLEALVERLEPAYGERVLSAFGEPLSPRTIAMSLASFERTLLSGDSDFDRYESGQRDAISPTAQRGRAVFFGKARCGSCHVPPLFTDFEYHNLGVGWLGPERGDRGRYEVTGDPEDLSAFRTPSLRDVSRTGPYMHDGSVATLREVVEFYDRGCGPNDALDRVIGPLGLSAAEIDGVVAFLETLEGRSYPLSYPTESPR